VTDIVLNLKNPRRASPGDSPESRCTSRRRVAHRHGRRHRGSPELEILNPELEIANLAGTGPARDDAHHRRGRRLHAGRAQPRPAATPFGVIRSTRSFLAVRRVAYQSRRPAWSAHRLRQAHGSTSRPTAPSTRRTRSRGCRDPHPPARPSSRTSRRWRAFGETAAIDAPVAGPEAALAHGMENFPSRSSSSASARTLLKRVGIETIGDLLMKTENELAAIPNFGRSRSRSQGDPAAATGSTSAATTAAAPTSGVRSKDVAPPAPRIPHFPPAANRRAARLGRPRSLGYECSLRSCIALVFRSAEARYGHRGTTDAPRTDRQEARRDWRTARRCTRTCRSHVRARADQDDRKAKGPPPSKPYAEKDDHAWPPG